MKRFVLATALLFAVLTSQNAFARLVTLEAEVHDASNNLVNGYHYVTVRIYNSGNTIVFSETHPGVLFSSGNFSISVGSLTTGGIPESCFDGTHSYTVQVAGIGRDELGPVQAKPDETTWTGFWKPVHLSPLQTTATIRAFPNPFVSSITLDIPVGDAGMATVVVYDLMGRKVATLIESRYVDNDILRVSWTPQHLETGAYVVQVEMNGIVSSVIPVQYYRH